MRKKSHISLARFLVRGLESDILSRRWKAFYVGNLLPDCRPSFLTMRHEYDGTFSLVERKIRGLVEHTDGCPMDSTRYMIELGQVFHYIADYFTFPHNRNYQGNLRDHCVYEKDLKFRLRAYIREGDAVFYGEYAGELGSVDGILKFIKDSHAEYMGGSRSLDEDCEYITRVCSRVLAAMWRLVDARALACAG